MDGDPVADDRRLGRRRRRRHLQQRCRDPCHLSGRRLRSAAPALFAARAAVLEELGRAEEAEEWYRRATIAAEALDDASGFEAGETVWVDEVEEEEDAEASDRAQPAGDASVEPATGDDDPQV